LLQLDLLRFTVECGCRSPHSAIDYLTPTEYEQAYYRENTSRKHPLPGEPALH